MKKRIYVMTILLVSGLLSGCGKMEGESDIKSISVQTEELSSMEDSEKEEERVQAEIENEIEDEIGDEKTEEKAEEDSTFIVDFGYDYTEDIKADVAYIVSLSSSLQEELKNMDKITEKYMVLSENAQTQGEMNMASQWFYMIWDAELNNLWNRFSDLADQNTKERVLEEQRNWIAMKEEITLMSLGSVEENGSMYPLLVNTLWEEKTKNRAYCIAKELAKLQGENFDMPEMSAKYGVFVDNQGTGSVYSSLITKEGWEGEEKAIISLYRLGELEGTFTDDGMGRLMFTSDDGNVKGIIQINGWDGATFEITEIKEATVFSVGEKFEFPIAI
ncbi:MAG: DUF1311 domain-containing protein [Lachnospiraceae bacterium]|nr:DUF1311 domain-containing protein [Lachnospiraceae bacterium]